MDDEDRAHHLASARQFCQKTRAVSVTVQPMRAQQISTPPPNPGGRPGGSSVIPPLPENPGAGYDELGLGVIGIDIEDRFPWCRTLEKLEDLEQLEADIIE